MHCLTIFQAVCSHLGHIPFLLAYPEISEVTKYIKLVTYSLKKLTVIELLSITGT
jgi:hypothetical protein